LNSQEREHEQTKEKIKQFEFTREHE